MLPNLSLLDSVGADADDAKQIDSAENLVNLRIYQTETSCFLSAACALVALTPAYRFGHYGVADPPAWKKELVAFVENHPFQRVTDEQTQSCLFLQMPNILQLSYAVVRAREAELMMEVMARPKHYVLKGRAQEESSNQTDQQHETKWIAEVTDRPVSEPLYNQGNANRMLAAILQCFNVNVLRVTAGLEQFYEESVTKHIKDFAKLYRGLKSTGQSHLHKIATVSYGIDAPPRGTRFNETLNMLAHKFDQVGMEVWGFLVKITAEGAQHSVAVVKSSKINATGEFVYYVIDSFGRGNYPIHNMEAVYNYLGVKVLYVTCLVAENGVSNHMEASSVEDRAAEIAKNLSSQLQP